MVSDSDNYPLARWISMNGFIVAAPALGLPRWLRFGYRRHRPMIERTIAWLTRGNRRLRYRGVSRNDHWLHHRAAALNLRRLVNLGLAYDGTGWALA